jgi:hypothetical protein
MTGQLILKRASASRPSGEWNDDDFDVLADGTVVGRILKAHAAPVGTPWMWTLAFGQHEDRTQSYAAAREAAMAAFEKSGRERSNRREKQMARASDRKVRSGHVEARLGQREKIGSRVGKRTLPLT